MTYKKWLLSSGVVASLFAAGYANAEDAATAAPPAAPPTAAQAAGENNDNGTTLGEVIVTSSKRAENLQDVAAAVSAFTSKERDQLGVSTIQDLTNFTPGLSYNTALDRVSIRGIGRNTNNLTADPGVATYVDGVYNAQTFNAAGDPLFTDRIEVLRGPEGTLYGRNSIGGAINSISKRPSDEFSAEVRAGAGNYDRTFVEGTITGPLAPKIQGRLNANYTDQSQGYFESVNGLHSEGGTTHSWYVEGQLQAQFTDKFDGWLKVSDRYFNNTTRSSALVGPVDTAETTTGTSAPAGNFVYCNFPGAFTACPTNVPPTNVSQLPGATNTNPTDLRKFQANQNGNAIDKDNYALTAQLNYELPFAQVKYTGGYQHYYYEGNSGFQPTGVTGYDYPCSGRPAGQSCASNPLFISAIVPNLYIEDKSFWSNEIDLQSKGTGPLNWIVGIYQYKEQYTQPVDYDIPGDTFLPLIAIPREGGLTSTAPVRTIDYYNTVANGTSYAAFGQVDWKPIQTLKFTGGIRYTQDHKDGTESTRQLFVVANQASANPTVINLTPGACTGPVTPGVLCIPNVTPAAPKITSSTGPTRIDANGIGYRSYDDTWSAVTGTAGVEWTPIEHNMFYGKYSRGYKSGGFNTGFITDNAETKPEFVNAYEIGYKGIIASAIEIDAALYDYDYQNDQVPLSVSIVGSPAQTQFFNIPKVQNQGAELEAVWAPTNHLTFNLSYDYETAVIKSVGNQCFADPVDPDAVQPGANTKGCPLAPGAFAVPTAGGGTAYVTQPGGPGSPYTLAAPGQNVKGATLPQTPRNKVSLNTQYRFDFEPGSLTLSGSYIWKDKTYSSFFNRPYNLAPAYDQIDLRALWTDKSNKYTLIAFVKNVADKNGYDNLSGVLLTKTYGYLPNPATTSTTVPVLDERISLTPPRTFGVEIQRRF
jgi:iron complex outermembrane receptor protein